MEDRMRIRVSLILFALAVCAGGTIARAVEAEDFIRRNNRAMHESDIKSPRAQALGGSYAALSNGSSGVYENPASLGAMSTHEGLTDLAVKTIDGDGRSVDIIKVNVGGAFNINALSPATYRRGRVGNQSAGLFYQHTNHNYSSEWDGREGGIHTFIGGWGRSFHGGRLFGGVSLGYNYGDNFADDDSWNHEWRRWDLRVGGIYRHTRKLAIGGLVRLGFGSFDNDAGMTLDDGSIFLLEFRPGVSYQMAKRTLLASDLSIEYLKLEDGADREMGHTLVRWSAGVEQVLLPNYLTGRLGGYVENEQFNTRLAGVGDENEADAGVTLGFSAYWRRLELGYTVDIPAHDDIEHNIRLEYDW